VGIATLWCPSDPTVAAAATITAEEAWFGPYPMTFHHTSYCGNQGPWWVFGLPPPSQAVLDQNLGVFHEQSAIKPAQVRDGLSQTIGFAERAHGLIDLTQAKWWNWWAASTADTNFTTWYGINPHHRFSGDLGAWATISSASSFHPGGAHFAFCDGSD